MPHMRVKYAFLYDVYTSCCAICTLEYVCLPLGITQHRIFVNIIRYFYNSRITRMKIFLNEQILIQKKLMKSQCHQMTAAF